MVVHDVSRELRDPTGKWAKSGGIHAAHSAAATKIAGLAKGKKMGLHGATIDNIPSKGLRVRIKGETRHYGSDHEAAAAAVVQGAHPERHPGAEGALRQVAGGRGKIPAPAPSPSPPKVPAGVPSEAELRDKTPDQLAEMANITRGQGDYPGRELTLQRIRSEQIRRQPKVAPRGTPATRQVGALDLKPGMTVTTGHWQGKPYGKHKVVLVQKSGPTSRSGGVRSSEGIYNTASTIITTAGGDKYEVSNNTKFTVHGEAPPEPRPRGLTTHARQQRAVARRQGPMTMEQVQQEISNKDAEIREMAAESGSPYYSPKDLIDVRRDDVTRQLAQGQSRIVAKVPSGSEVQFTAETARHLLGQNVRPPVNRPKGVPGEAPKMPAPPTGSTKGAKVSMAGLPAGYSVHRSSQTDYMGKPLLEVHHETQGHIANLRPVETSTPVGVRGNVAYGGFKHRKGFNYTLTNPEVKAYSQAQYKEKIRSGQYMGGAGKMHESTLMDPTAKASALRAIGQHDYIMGLAHPESKSDIPPGTYFRPAPGGLIKAFKVSGAAAFFDNEAEAKKWLNGDPTAKHHQMAGPVHIPGIGTSSRGRRR